MIEQTAPGTTPPFYSVIVPLYNKKAYVERALSSVLSQTFKDFELIVVDDGSTDEGPAIVRGLADPRIRFFSQANSGVSAARNMGVMKSTGRYIAFLDADDEYAPDFLAAVEGLIADFPEAGIYGTNYWIDDGKGKWENPVKLPGSFRGLRRDFYDLMYYSRPPFFTGSVVLPAPLARETPFPVGIRAGEDIFVWFKIALRNEMAYLKEPYSTYFIEAENNAHKKYHGAQYHLDWLDLGDQYEKEGLLTPSGRKFVVWGTLVRVRKMIANGNRKEALGMLDWCPKRYFTIYQFYLLFQAFIPAKVWNILRPKFVRFAHMIGL